MFKPSPVIIMQADKQIVLVTHGAFAHFLTEDWDVEDPMTGTAWLNCTCTQ